jgi:hypothetical protein
MTDLRQNTAATVRIGRFVDATDAVTAETALTITPALRRLSKNGGAFAATSDGSNATHDSDGWYSCTLTATDLNTAGSLEMGVVVAGAAPYQRAWRVLPAQAYDALYVNPLIAKAIQYGTAQGGGAAAITLASTASTTDDRYNGRLVYIYDGTATGEVGYVQDYVGSSRGCVMAANWVTAPDATSKLHRAALGGHVDARRGGGCDPRRSRRRCHDLPAVDPAGELGAGRQGVRPRDDHGGLSRPRRHEGAHQPRSMPMATARRSRGI